MNDIATRMVVRKAAQPLNTEAPAINQGVQVAGAAPDLLEGSVPQGDRANIQRLLHDRAREAPAMLRYRIEQLTSTLRGYWESPPLPPAVNSQLRGLFQIIVAPLNVIITPAYREVQRLVSSVVALLRPRSSVITFTEPPRAPFQNPHQDTVAPKDMSAMHANAAILSLVAPRDTATGALQAALELAATEARRARSEGRAITEKKADHEQHLKVAVTRNQIHAIDAGNGIINSMAEQIINQLEGPFAISPESALARIEELQRSEKS